MTKIYTKYITLLIVCTIASLTVVAQPDSSGSVWEEINDVPIDGAIALLAAAGAGIGLKKLYKAKK